MIEFDNVHKQYSDGTQAVNGLSFEVEEGTTTVLVGPSGCGKTTTMQLVNRLEEPTEGTVYYDGTDIQELPATELRRQIGYVIQDIGLFDHMTIAENVATVPELKGWDDDRTDERVDELLDLMGLPPEEYRDSYPGELSGGQQQRVGVARALAAGPDVMLMDEPFGALDPITRENLQDEFLDIQEEIDTTIIFVTHDINEALKMGDKIAMMNDGELVQYDTPSAMLEAPATKFVEDFIGPDRTLKQLRVLQVSEIMRTDVPNEHRDVVEAFDPADTVMADGGELIPVTPSDSAQVALSRCIQAGVRALPVVEDATVIGVVTEEDIRSYHADEIEAASE
ncbi:ABC transporter ATP-binding protein [Halococcus thailandensis]|uniref:Molybdate/tungstate import ATP-binding protein WtpC n=1 Tax=Halococcus thailandensis JCM 13552 TaxID=1227457 RepID=M0N1W0_9EURY|nr:ABC transporter ATP-binding protein [Halococcus thailandensis]EMA51099.1 ABC transporter [Halococcus thailandensis JCM 13552]